MVKHINCQDEQTNLSKQIMNEQIANEWPGLSKQAQSICDKLKVTGLFDNKITKKQFKGMVKKACIQCNEQDLQDQISQYKKMSALRDESTKGNGYFYTETLKNARTIFRFRVEIFEAK